MGTARALRPVSQASHLPLASHHLRHFRLLVLAEAGPAVCSVETGNVQPRVISHWNLFPAWANLGRLWPRWTWQSHRESSLVLV